MMTEEYVPKELPRQTLGGGGGGVGTKVEISHLFHEEFQGIIIEILNKLEDRIGLT